MLKQIKYYILFLLFLILTLSGAPVDKKEFNVEETQQILYSQSSIDSHTSKGISLIELSNAMKDEGFNSKYPIEVVRMKSLVYTTLDNRRLAAAQIARVKIHAEVHEYEDPLPKNQLRRFKGATNYGEAVKVRMRAGSYENINDADGYQSSEVKIRTRSQEETEKFQEVFGSRHTISLRLRKRPAEEANAGIGSAGHDNIRTRISQRKGYLPRYPSFLGGNLHRDHESSDRTNNFFRASTLFGAHNTGPTRSRFGETFRNRNSGTTGRYSGTRVPRPVYFKG